MSCTSIVKRLLFLSLALCVLTLSYSQTPNFILIVLDDQGWTGTSTMMDSAIPESASDYYFTPEISRLAEMGMVFSQAYAPSPKCSPSRASLLTGRSTAKNGFTNTGNSVATGEILIEATSRNTIDPAWTTYAEWLKSSGLGYRTAHLGKWHLGNTDGQLPENNGFDVSDGGTSNDDGNSGSAVNEDPKRIFDLTDRSIDFITQALEDGVPFALQLSHYAVHTDVESRQATLDLYNDPTVRPPGLRHDNAAYGAMTEDTDTGIGLLWQALEDLNALDNTYIFLLSDNGGQLNQTDNSPLAFGKTFIYEGGIRIPFIAYGPGIEAGTYAQQAVVGYDLFPTLAELSGSNQELPEDLDGKSIVPLFSENTFERDGYLFFHSPHYDNNRNKSPRSAIVDDNYKLLVEYETGGTFLFDLAGDIGETEDLSEEMPAYTLELLIALRGHLKSTGALLPGLDPSHANFSGAENDVDSDGLDDDWEFRELLSYTYGPEDDPDFDGIMNMQEYQTGSDPLVGDEVVSSLSLSKAQDIVIYPNPAGDYLNFQTETEVDQVLIFDSKGRKVHQKEGSGVRINIDFLKSGIYYLKISIEDTTVVKKFVVD